MMDRNRTAVVLGLLALAITGATAASPPNGDPGVPVAVSPGAPHGMAPVADPCPTFLLGRMPGAVVGMALEPLTEGTGVIRVLVSLL